MSKNLMVDKREQRRKRRSDGGFSPNFVWLGSLESNHSFKETIQPASVTTAAATHNNALQLQQPPVVIITVHGCLLIPAVFLAWWYWTKRTARRVVRGVLTYTSGGSSTTVDTTTICHSTNDGSKLSPNDIGYKSASASTVHATNETPSNNKDQYHSLGDCLHENSSSDSCTTSRFRWMKGTKSSCARQKVRSVPLQNLRRKGQFIPTSSSTPKRKYPTYCSSTISTPRYFTSELPPPPVVESTSAVRKNTALPTTATTAALTLQNQHHHQQLLLLNRTHQPPQLPLVLPNLF
jgi:hypothetical protein